MEKIKASVGRNGDNNVKDVVLIQKMPNYQKIPGVVVPIPVSGKADKETITRIEKFEKKVVLASKATGLLAPGSKAYAKLSANKPKINKAHTYSLSMKASNLLKEIEE